MLNRSGWYCDASFEKGGCRRGLAGDSSSANIPYYECKKCDYDLCDKCAGYKVSSKEEDRHTELTKAVITCKKGHKLAFRKT